MADIKNITDFSKGEQFQVKVLARNRDGTPLSDAANTTFEFIISDEVGGVALLTFNSSPQIILTDAAAADWAISLSPADLTTLTEETKYWYEVWTTSAGGIEVHQNKGALTFEKATGN